MGEEKKVYKEICNTPFYFCQHHFEVKWSNFEKSFKSRPVAEFTSLVQPLSQPIEEGKFPICGGRKRGRF